MTEPRIPRRSSDREAAPQVPFVSPRRWKMPRIRCLSPRWLLIGLAVLGFAVLVPLCGPLAWQLPARADVDAPGVKLALPVDWLRPLTWRSLGPANMGGRVVALSVFEADPSTWWVATASGGLLKTTNNGVTFEHQFDREATVSIGDVQVAQSNKEIVWVGTGENNPRNSV